MTRLSQFWDAIVTPKPRTTGKEYIVKHESYYIGNKADEVLELGFGFRYEDRIAPNITCKLTKTQKLDK